jgi:hypothetical protein
MKQRNQAGGTATKATTASAPTPAAENCSINNYLKILHLQAAERPHKFLWKLKSSSFSLAVSSIVVCGVEHYCFQLFCDYCGILSEQHLVPADGNPNLTESFVEGVGATLAENHFEGGQDGLA